MKNLSKISVAAIFISGFAMAQDYSAIVANYLERDTRFRNVATVKKQFIIENQDSSGSLGGTVLQIQQAYNGLPIYGSVASALVKDNAVAYFSNNFIDFAAGAFNASKKGLSKASVFDKVLADLGMARSELDHHYNPDVAKDVYFDDNKVLKYSYEFNFGHRNGSYWNIVADASTGNILTKSNLTLSCNFDHSGSERHTSAHPLIGPRHEIPHGKFLLAPNNATYNVFALPVEAPSFGSRTLVTNPWNPAASPDGWHSDGTNSYEYSKGNNAFAYTDLLSDNKVGRVAEGGPNRIFDFPLDINTPYENYEQAALTNLFYMNNMMHDISYAFGFTESARNFQTNNYGKGGSGNDAVLAEARDGAAKSVPNLDNANFSTPADGGAPRMQMYLWSPKEVNRLFYNSPNSFVSRRPRTQGASFGPALTPEGVAGDLALVTPKDGCTDISTDLTGKIAVIERGTCNFSLKVKNAQLKGAVGAIIYNPPSNTAFGTMGGTDASITIPSILVDSSEGAAIQNQLASGSINAKLSDDKSKYIYLDGDLDNGIIAHEYTHGISNRLTGNGYSCLSYSNDNEQMGEGWSDFLALMLTLRANDNANVPRGMGTFASAQETTDLGIRPARYSPDLNINNYTYGKTNGMTTTSSTGGTVPHVHSIGFVWATILWDLNWKYVEKYGYNANVMADKQSGTARVLQLVMDGMKLQGCNPTFTTGRDALIAADQSATGGQNKCLIWSVFARRGVGVNANPGLIKPVSTASANVIAALNDQVEDFTVPAECKLSTSETAVKNSVVVYPNPAKNEIRFRTDSTSLGKTIITILDASGKQVLQDRIRLSTDSVNVSSLPAGLYIVQGDGVGGKFTQKIIIGK